MHYDDKNIKTLNRKYIPDKVWKVVLDLMETSDKEDFYKSCRIHQDTPCSQKEREWINYIRSEPQPQEIADKIIKQAYNFFILKYILLVSRRANPQLRKETDPTSEYGQELAYYLLMNFYSPREYQLIDILLPSINLEQARELVNKHIIVSDEMEMTKSLIKKYHLEEDVTLPLASNDLRQSKVDYYFDNDLVKFKYPGVLTSIAIKNDAIFFLIRLSEQYPDIIKSSIENIGIEKFYRDLEMRVNFQYHQEQFNQWFQKLFGSVPSSI